MKKLNNKGFLLVEMVVVSVFVLAIFVLLLQNGLPLITEYEKRGHYDDIDSVYAVNMLKEYIKNAKLDGGQTLYDAFITKLNDNDTDYFEIKKSGTGLHEYSFDNEVFNKLKDILGIGNDCKIIISKWDVSSLRSDTMTNRISGYNRGLSEYISYLYKTAVTEKGVNNKYRIIISRKVDDKYYYASLKLDDEKSEDNKTLIATYDVGVDVTGDVGRLSYMVDWGAKLNDTSTSIVLPAKSTTDAAIQFGPYVPMNVGCYYVEYSGSNLDNELLVFDSVYDAGNKAVDIIDINKSSTKVGYYINLLTVVPNIEYRARNDSTIEESIIDSIKVYNSQYCK